MKITVNDIALRAGVSPSTVSNALNNKKGINEDTKKQIKQIALELGYSKVETPRSKKIKVIVYKKSGIVLSDTPFFSELIEAIEKNCTMNHYETSIQHYIESDDTYDTISNLIRDDSYSGLLILATEMLPEDLYLFEEVSVPIVLMDSCFKNHNVDSVTINNYEGAYRSTVYMIDRGHRNIGHFRANMSINNFSERKTGYQDALNDYGLQIEPYYEYILEPSFEGAYRDMKKMLEQGSPLPSAAFVDNDVIAIGAIKAIKEHGLTIPNDISIVSFDDMPYCEISDPPLTSNRVFPREIGRMAVSQLLYKIESHNSPVNKIVVNTKLIERESVTKHIQFAYFCDKT